MAHTDKHTDKQTDKQTDGHGDSMTESAQWANSVIILSLVALKTYSCLADPVLRWYRLKKKYSSGPVLFLAVMYLIDLIQLCKLFCKYLN